MEVIPAIDLRGGKCVRLYQGDYNKETIYSEDPLEVALRWQELGASRLHVVDLDGALAGTPINAGVINGIAALVNIPIQVGGGIRTLDAAEGVIGMGADRIILGTTAVENPTLVAEACRKLGSDAVIVSVDARDGKVAIKGWTENTRFSTLELVDKMAQLGVERFVFTDISLDGTLAAPNLQIVSKLVEKTGLKFLASGGISSVEHLRILAKTGVEGAIIGKALYTGAIDLQEALISIRTQEV
ncbi:MAG: 1-(5-phosphoribosyl)-5-[(5-phosphoribosylamino)methylideneamino]imidazole-4-carboxamide isomerase [Chloroflexi bacterium]|nr:1-(5-phosphoribosyl)-5-[(5-phosphoribosylamino)methylideneamino]imidazole-4-carboxamide isomerase [Chloroflexota bacterium]